MPATNAARDFLTAAAIGESTVDFTTTNAYIGVGDSATAFAVTQTDLQAATNKFRKPMNAGYPTRAANVITFQATFLETEANFTWAEWSVHNALTGGTMLSRLVQALGVKPGTEQWRFSATITVTV